MYLEHGLYRNQKPHAMLVIALPKQRCRVDQSGRLPELRGFTELAGSAEPTKRIKLAN